MNKYGIATLLEDCPAGYEFIEDNTPLHLTYVDAFEIELAPSEFINKMQHYFHDQPKFSVMPIADELYGPDKDIPVTVMELNSALKELHDQLIKYLESEKAIFINPQFVGDGYKPHISIYGLRRVAIGEPITINGVSIGNKRTDIQNPPNRIIATIPFL
jgi:hypothetical protein